MQGWKWYCIGMRFFANVFLFFVLIKGNFYILPMNPQARSSICWDQMTIECVHYYNTQTYLRTYPPLAFGQINSDIINRVPFVWWYNIQMLMNCDHESNHWPCASDLPYNMAAKSIVISFRLVDWMHGYTLYHTGSTPGPCKNKNYFYTSNNHADINVNPQYKDLIKMFIIFM